MEYAQLTGALARHCLTDAERHQVYDLVVDSLQRLLGSPVPADAVFVDHAGNTELLLHGSDVLQLLALAVTGHAEGARATPHHRAGAHLRAVPTDPR